MWKSHFSDKIKWLLFQVLAVSVRLNRCTTWKLTKSMEETLGGNYTRMLHAALNKATFPKAEAVWPFTIFTNVPHG